MKQRLEAAERWLWRRDHPQRLQRAAALCARHATLIIRNLASGQLSLRAMSLVYTSLLSLVPMLALAFSMFKALGVHNALQPTLMRLLEPLGERAEELTAQIIGFVENIQVGVLGSLGVGLLLYAAVSLIQKVEAAFNWIWRVKTSRPIGARFSEYLSVLIIGPFAVFLSVGVTASVLNSDLVQAVAEVEPFGAAIYAFARALPYLIIIGVFTFLYSFMPNTRVPLRAALGGGVFAGFLWQSASVAFATFVSNSGNYNAIYSGFAIVIFLLIWLYVGWLILLLGSQLSFYLAHPECVRRGARDEGPSPRDVEQIGLALMAEIARRHSAGEPPVLRQALAGQLMAPAQHVDPIVDALIDRGVLAETSNPRNGILPARDLATLPLSEVWQLLRSAPETPLAPPSSHPAMQAAETTISQAEAAVAEQMHDSSVRAWVETSP